MIGSRDWRSHVPEGVRPYIEGAPLAAVFLGIVWRRVRDDRRHADHATRTVRDQEDNFKFLWAPPVDNRSFSIPSRRQQRLRLSPQLFVYIFACESSPLPGLRILTVARLKEKGKVRPYLD